MDDLSEEYRCRVRRYLKVGISLLLLVLAFQGWNFYRAQKFKSSRGKAHVVFIRALDRADLFTEEDKRIITENWEDFDYKQDNPLTEEIEK